MSTNSNDNGRAYEYAWLLTLAKKLIQLRKTNINHNSSFEANKKAWNAIAPQIRELYEISVNAAIDALFELEPCMEENSNDELILEFQKDEVGEKGDVRDIIIRRNEIHWEIGLSIKHNHTAVKHSRLSHVLDFGNEWYNIPCSDEYWTDVKPIFDMLIKEKEKRTKWSELPQKEQSVYIPLLQAFLNEINRTYVNTPSFVEKLFEYLVGLKDYHKIVSIDTHKLTIIHTFNIHGTLNKPSSVKISALEVPILNMPTEILATRFKKESGTTVEIYMDNGWAFSFRIHSASTYVQPSLKFDVQFISTPVSALKIECKWNKVTAT